MSAHEAAVIRAQAGLCSHGGHGWDDETCDEIPDDGETVPDEIAEQMWQDAHDAFHETGDYWIGNQE